MTKKNNKSGNKKKNTSTKGQQKQPVKKPSFRSLLIQYILLTLAFYFMLKSCEKSKEAEEKAKVEAAKRDSLVKKETVKVVRTTDSVAIDSLRKEIGDFAYALTIPEQPPVKIETDLLKLKINTRGGAIDYLALKTFKNADGSLVTIVNNNQNFDIKLKLKNSKFISTQNWRFIPETTETDSTYNVKLKLKASENKYLIFNYIIPKHDYLIDFYVTSSGLENILADGTYPLHWDLKAFSHEKDPNYEDKFTTLKYLYGDNKTGELSAMKKEDSDEADQVRWVDYKQYFFSSFLISKDKPFKHARFKQIDIFKIKKDSSYTKHFYLDTEIEVKNGQLNEHFKWYHGPTDFRKLATYGYQMEEVIPLGWGIFGWINKYVFFPLFDFLKKFISNYGLIIIIITIIVRLVTSPLYYKTYVSQAKMKIIRPEMEEINKKYKDNPMKRQQEIMKLQSKAGVSPLSGCIPSLLFIPIFYALFRFFPAAIDLRQKHFLWIDDLSSYEAILKFKHSIPLLGSHLSLFALLASVVMFFYMKMNQSGQSASMPTQEGMPDLSKMMKWMIYLSPVMMFFFFNNYASGLSLYYFISTLLSLIIVYVIKEFVIDEEKVKAQIEENKKKPRKQSKFSQKMQQLMEQAERQRQLQEEMKKRRRKK